MNLNRRINSIYTNRKPVSSREMELSRSLSIYEGCTARTIVTLTSGAFLAGYAKFLGASDQIAGIIAAVPVLASALMVVSPLIYERMENRKFITCLFCIIGRLLLGAMIFIPFIKVSYQVKILLLIVIYFTANAFTAFTLPAAQIWLQSITPESIRGRYFGKRESVIVAFVTTITLIMGQVLDKTEQIGQQLTGFIILYSFVTIAAVANFILFSFMKEPMITLYDTKLNLKAVLVLPVKNRKFLNLALLIILWNFSFQIGIPFTSVYMVSGLKLSYGIITAMIVFASLVSVISARYWGKIADRKSWMYLLQLIVILQILSFFIWFFISNKITIPLLITAHFFGGAAISGINICINNLLYDYSPKEHKTVYMGFASAVGGAFGFFGTLTGSFLLKLTSDFKINLLGTDVGNIQLICLCSGIALIGCILFIKYILRIDKKLLQ